MFSRRDLSPELESVRNEHTPDALVFDTPDFETLPPARAEELGIAVERFEPIAYIDTDTDTDTDIDIDEWLPSNAPPQLRKYVGDGFTIGMPGDGGVAWTTQTDPPSVFVKERMEGSPDPFTDFLIAEAFVQAGLALPEHFIGFFEAQYRELDNVTPLSPAGTYQLANALYEAYLGLYTCPVFESWNDTAPDLYDAWADAGERLAPRLSGLSREVATGQTSFAAAAEIGCSAVKHGLDIPTPFVALDTPAYRETGPQYAVAWTRKTFDSLRDT